MSLSNRTESRAWGPLAVQNACVIRFLPGVLVLILWIYCLVDVITSRDGEARHLGKTVWIFIVLLFPFIGSLAWLILGRPTETRPLSRSEGAAPSFPEYERRGRFAAEDPEKDEEFLRQVRERAEQQRKAYEEKKRREREGEQAA
jgi:hypothetical protein